MFDKNSPALTDSQQKLNVPFVLRTINMICCCNKLPTSHTKMHVGVSVKVCAWVVGGKRQASETKSLCVCV